MPHRSLDVLLPQEFQPLLRVAVELGVYVHLAVVVLVLVEDGEFAPPEVREPVRPAERGEPRAQYVLGRLYGSGQDVPQDYAEALRWHRKAAEQGFAAARFNLGLMYDSGHGVKQDYAEAVNWYRKGAERGLADAQYSLGLMYTNGYGVEQDYVQAYMWYNLAAAAGDNEARTARDRLTPRMGGGQIAEAQRLSVQFKPQKRWRGPVD